MTRLNIMLERERQIAIYAEKIKTAIHRTAHRRLHVYKDDEHLASCDICKWFSGISKNLEDIRKDIYDMIKEEKLKPTTVNESVVEKELSDAREYIDQLERELREARE